MNPIRVIRAFAITLCLAVPVQAWAVGTVTDGDVTFGYSFNFGTSSGNTVNADLTGAGGGDQLWESWWFFRMPGDARTTAFSAPDAEVYTLNGGTTGRLDWNDPGGAGLFSAALYFEVIDTGVDEGVVFQNLEITNTGLGDLEIDLFHYTDFDLAGSAGNDQATLGTNPDGIQIDVSDATDFAPFIGYDADAFKVTTYRSLLNDLTRTTGTTPDLDDSGLDFAVGTGADFTGAFQWNAVIGAGSSDTFLTQLGANTTPVDPSVSAVPEPSTLLLTALGLAGLSSRAGRRRS